MVVCKIDGEINMQNCEYSTKLWNGDGGDWCSMANATAVATDSCRRFSKRWHVADVKNIAGGNQATLMVDRNSANIAYIFCFYVCLHIRDRNCCSASDGNGSCHVASLFFDEMIPSWRQKHRWRWPGSIEQFHTITKIHAYEIKQDLSKNIFLLLGRHHYDGIAHCFFPIVTCNGVCSQLQKIISQQPWPHKKTEIYILKSFFVEICSKTIDIIRNKNIYFLFLNMCKAGHLDNHTIVQVAF